MDTVIHNIDYLITMDPKRRILTDGAVGIEGQDIVFIGKTNDLPDHAASKVIDARGKMVLPGFIDCHAHQMQQFTRGITRVPDVFGCLFTVTYPTESALSSEDAYCSAQLAQAEMIKHGTTCFIDPGSAFPLETARATGETGMRGIVSRHTWDIPSTSLGRAASGIYDSTEEAIARAEEVVNQIDGSWSGRVKGSFSLRVLLGTSDELCQGMHEKAKDHDVPLITHAGTNPTEVDLSRSGFGDPEIIRLDRLEALSSRLGLIHMGWITHDELPLLQEHDVKVIADPGTSMHFGLGNVQFGRYPEMLRMGITVSLSTDSAGWMGFDHIRQAQLFMGGLREARMDPTVTSPETALEVAIINGARTAMWEEAIGSLEVGKRADLVLFDTERPEWRPLYDPVATPISSASGDGADTVLIDGQVVMENRRLTKVDEATLITEAQGRAEEVLNRTGLGKFAQTPWPVS